MSTSLAIAGVSHALRDLLNDGLVNHNVRVCLEDPAEDVVMRVHLRWHGLWPAGSGTQQAMSVS